MNAVMNRFMVDAVVSKDQAEHLISLANKAFAAQEESHNTGKSANIQIANFERYAKKLGLSVTWPGMWPLLHKNGRELHLPE